MTYKILNTMKINCDMGEGMDSDADIMPYIHQANICCGAYAGNENITIKTIELAKKYGKSIGAHIGFPDRQNFGRKILDISISDVLESCKHQMDSFMAQCCLQNIRCTYIKPHGALNTVMMQDMAYFNAMAQLAHLYKMDLMIPLDASKTVYEKILQDFGIQPIWEVFADRAYESDGRLRSRALENALHTDSHIIQKQIEYITQYYKIPLCFDVLPKTDSQHMDSQHMDLNNKALYFDCTGADSICIHGDNPASIQAIILGRNETPQHKA